MSSLWQEAFDEASQCTYYYHVETGETSWTLPQDDGQLEEDLSFMAFAVVRLQARLRGQRDRRRVARLLRARYVTTEDPATQQTLYTDRRTGGSSWTPPALFARLGVGDAHGRDDEDEDEELDFDAFHAEEADDNAEDTTANEANGAGSGDEEQDGEDDEDPRRARKKKRKFPRSAAQLRVDEAEDLEDAALVLDLSGLNAWRLSSRIWNLATLTRLSLARNQLTRVPSGIQDLIRLEHLDLSHNHLTRLPSCLQTTTTLTFLDASHNRIASFSPRLWKLRGLQELHLAWNSLHELPYVEGDLKLLRDTREWEVGVGLLTQLRVLDLGHNRLTSVPTSIEKCVALTLLDLSHNRLTSLTDELCEAEALTELHVGANVLAELPEALGSLSNLARLNVESNRLTLLPESIGNLQRLEEIDLRRNQIHQLPQEFGALGQLRRIYLDENANLATLPTCLRFLPSVECFSASKCGLVAMDAVDLLSKAPLSLLRLSDNAFIDFPLDLRRSAMKTTLQDLDLARNSLHAFPLEVVETPCASLVRLDLSHNRLREIPSEISKLRSLRSLVLSHNYLGPALPEAVAWLPQLLELRCDHNQLTRLPLAIGILKKLEHVGAEFNQIQELPTSFLDLADSLRSLHVNDNHLAREPPVVSLLSPSCFVDLSNNPFCVDSDDGPKLQQQVQDVYAAAAKRFAEGAFGEAEELVTTSLALLEGNHGAGWWKVRQHQLPAQLYLRALCRFMTLKHARTVVEEVTEVIEECEQLLRGAQFVRLRPAYRPPKQKSLLKRGSGNQTDENTDENPASEGDLRAIQKRVSAVSNQSEHEDSIHERLSTAQGERAGARTAAAAAVEGALGDLGRAIRLGIPELATAYCLQGHLHMATLEFALAIESFTLALAASGNSENLTPTGTSIVMARAEAYRLLGQLPAALDDVQRVLDSRPADAPAYVQAKAEALAREWARHQSQYFVDHEGLFRAFDVAPTSGLARRPEVHDVHAILTADQKRGLQCTPGERFDASVAAVTRDMEQAKQKTRRAMQASYDQKAVTLRRARDFKREIRENLAMEMEERTQRIVEAELARIAELKRQEMDREFNERMFMKYEDEYMKWLVGEEMRLDAERKRREEEARRRAEAKAQYEMRLARRGGRRQQLASRGAAARKPSVARSPSPPRGGSSWSRSALVSRSRGAPSTSTSSASASGGDGASPSRGLSRRGLDCVGAGGRDCGCVVGGCGGATAIASGSATTASATPPTTTTSATTSAATTTTGARCGACGARGCRATRCARGPWCLGAVSRTRRADHSTEGRQSLAEVSRAFSHIPSESRHGRARERRGRAAAPGAAAARARLLLGLGQPASLARAHRARRKAPPVPQRLRELLQRRAQVALLQGAQPAHARARARRAHGRRRVAAHGRARAAGLAAHVRLPARRQLAAPQPTTARRALRVGRDPRVPRAEVPVRAVHAARRAQLRRGADAHARGQRDPLGRRRPRRLPAPLPGRQAQRRGAPGQVGRAGARAEHLGAVPRRPRVPRVHGHALFMRFHALHQRGVRRALRAPARRALPAAGDALRASLRASVGREDVAAALEDDVRHQSAHQVLLVLGANAVRVLSTPGTSRRINRVERL